jgi:hypothetical protein
MLDRQSQINQTILVFEHDTVAFTKLYDKILK